MSMSRKIKSFFEFHTELYFNKEGILTTDIEDVSVTINDTVIGFTWFVHPIAINDESVVDGVIEIVVGDAVHSILE